MPAAQTLSQAARNPRGAGRKSTGAREHPLTPYLHQEVIERIHTWRATETEPFTAALNRLLDAWRTSEVYPPAPVSSTSAPARGRSRDSRRVKKSVALTPANRKWVEEHAAAGETQGVALARLLTAAPPSLLPPPPRTPPAQPEQPRHGGARAVAGRTPKRGSPRRNATLSQLAIDRVNERRLAGERFSTALNRIVPLLRGEDAAGLPRIPSLPTGPRQQVNAYFTQETRERVQQLRREGEAWSTALNRLLEGLPSRAFILGQLIAVFEREQVLYCEPHMAVELAARDPGSIVTPALSAMRLHGREGIVYDTMGTLPLRAIGTPSDPVDQQEVFAGYESAVGLESDL
jgi:hypothetical protein